MKLGSLEHNSKYIGSSSSLFGDTSTTMYESKTEEELSSSTRRGGEVGQPLGALIKRRNKQKGHAQ
jgi:hypothetical protein